MRFRFAVIVMVLAITLSGCHKPISESDKGQNSTPTSTQPETSLNTPRTAFVSPATKRLVKLEEALKAYLTKSAIDWRRESVCYQYNFADLNGDGDNELIVLLIRSDSNDKELLLLEDDYQTWIGQFNFKTPMFVMNEKVNGWYKIALYESKGRYQVTTWNSGGGYHLDKSKENVIDFSQLSGTSYLSDSNTTLAFQLK